MNLPNHATNETLSRKGYTAVEKADIACPKCYKVSMSERMVARERTQQVGTALENNTEAFCCDGHGVRAHRSGDGGVDSVAFFAGAVRDGLFRQSSGLTVDGDRSGETELGTGGHYVAYFKFDC